MKDCDEWSFSGSQSISQSAMSPRDLKLAYIFCNSEVYCNFGIFLPAGNPEASYWITHAGCLLVLVLINCSNSILVRGVYIDAEEEGGKCVVFPCYYLRLFFQVSQ
jgi:hypothetical protein